MNFRVPNPVSAAVLPALAVVLGTLGAFGLGACAGEGAENLSSDGAETLPDPSALASNETVPASEGAACEGNPAGQSEPLSTLACLRKFALDLTNRRPTDQEIADVQSGTKSLQDMADVYLATPQFSTVVLRWFLSEFEPTDLIPENADKEEPARLAQYLVTNDIDFRQLVTADYSIDGQGAKTTVANAAGILTTQAFLSAYTGNRNRNWSGHLLSSLTGIVLVPVQEVPPGVDASREGLAAIPACAGCHVNPVYGVDFLAAFHDCHDDKGLPIAGCALQEKQFLGKTGKSLPDLGKILSDSVEWRATAIQTFYKQLGGRAMGKNEVDQYRAYEGAWEAAGYKPKALIKHIVTSPQYCAQ